MLIVIMVMRASLLLHVTGVQLHFRVLDLLVERDKTGSLSEYFVVALACVVAILCLLRLFFVCGYGELYSLAN